jgi:hypothetical protein
MLPVWGTPVHLLQAPVYGSPKLGWSARKFRELAVVPDSAGTACPGSCRCVRLHRRANACPQPALLCHTIAWQSHYIAWYIRPRDDPEKKHPCPPSVLSSSPVALKCWNQLLRTIIYRSWRFMTHGLYSEDPVFHPWSTGLIRTGFLSFFTHLLRGNGSPCHDIILSWTFSTSPRY